jgi:hypothetical protein
MRRFKALFFWVGLPIGLMVDLGVGARPLVNFIDFALTALLTAGIVAALLACVIGRIPRKSGPHLLYNTLALVAIETATLVGSIAVLWLAALFPHGGWQRMPDAPAGAVGFVGRPCIYMGNPGSDLVYLVTKAGALFVASSDAPPSGQWSATTTSPDTVRGGSYCRRTTETHYSTPVKLGRAKASYQVEDQGADCSGHRHYRLQENNTVWRWGTGSCAIGVLAGLAFYILAVSVLGIIVFTLIAGPPVVGKGGPPGDLAETTDSREHR